MTDLLADNPTLLLFVVAGLGFLIGRVRVGGFGLGIAAVLFAGIAVSAFDERLELPEPIWGLGLAVFVYTVGLSSGPGFVAAMRRRGLFTNLLALAAIVLAAGAVVVARVVLDVAAAAAVGGFAGGLTNTPALAGVLELMRARLPAETFAELGAEPVVGYSLAYPVGVLVPLLSAFWLLRGPRRVAAAAAQADTADALVCRTVRVTRGHSPSLAALRDAHAVTFSRLRHEGHVGLATAEAEPRPGDLVTVIGTPAAVEAVIAELGEASTEHLALDRRRLDMRRIFVSSRQVAGKHLGELDLGGRFGAVVTRVRRGDVDMLADDDTVLELGDRVRVVAPRERLGDVSRFFGDSYKALGEVDILTFSAGIALGLLLGEVPVPLPGGQSFSLGSAGGPLLVGLVLGALGRTGRVVWQLPYTANLVLRQLGMVLFLAGIGTRSGQAFATTIADGGALPILAVGAVATVVAVAVTVLVGARLLRLPPAVLAGALAAVQTQPAVLAFASEQVGEDDREVTTGYATAFPVAMIAKLVIAQLLAAGLLPL